MSLHTEPLIKKAPFSTRLKSLRHGLGNLNRLLQKRITQHIFTAADDAPSYLDISLLEELQKKYPIVDKAAGYDPNSREARGINYSNLVLSMPGAQEAGSFLEIGGNDGMVSCALARKGKQSIDIDLDDTVFDERAADAGVNFYKMDAHHMQFKDESFDFLTHLNILNRLKMYCGKQYGSLKMGGISS
jgi:2-polyprenyl-3-methyl-5-hydroxy-6-metoxy-1,4-benzoquinol methylase